MARSEKSPEKKTPEQALLGPNLSFAGKEAYHLLRTNINMCAVADSGCPIIGVTSAVKGEGKSTTVVNLAYAMAEEGKKVLLVELDMRLPVIAKNLGIKGTPGMSDLLVKHAEVSEVIYKTQLHPKLYVIPAGTIPPNPSEMMGSAFMEKAMHAFAGTFDYVLLDLPPVNLVADALIISKLTTGMVLVVRRGLCRKRDLKEALRRLNMVDAKVYGIVETHAQTHRKNYRKYGYKYGYGYGYGYGSSHSKADKAKAGSQEQADGGQNGT